MSIRHNQPRANNKGRVVAERLVHRSLPDLQLVRRSFSEDGSLGEEGSEEGSGADKHTDG